jgi:hypothetical protein
LALLSCRRIAPRMVTGFRRCMYRKTERAARKATVTVTQVVMVLRLVIAHFNVYHEFGIS